MFMYQSYVIRCGLISYQNILIIFPLDQTSGTFDLNGVNLSPIGENVFLLRCIYLEVTKSRALHGSHSFAEEKSRTQIERPTVWDKWPRK